MKIGIIGSGNVGGTLGTRWAKAGHEVVFGSRNPQSAGMQELVRKAGAKARAASTAEAVKAGEILLLATPWPATRQILESLGDLGGKVLIDLVNPAKADLSGLAIGTSTSAGEHVAGWARNARVVKAFNTVGLNIMENPSFGKDRPVMFYCGDDSAAKLQVKQLAGELGFEPVDAGPLTQARLLEPFAMLWISLALQYGLGREIAFKLLRR
jgi:8-hydroxy-5-deazaflavin:NADPH oxidoreductase